MLATTSRKSNGVGCITFFRLNMSNCRVRLAARSAAKKIAWADSFDSLAKPGRSISIPACP